MPAQSDDSGPPLSLYLHIPFCQRKCPYCDFNTYAGLERLFEPFTRALVQEIEAAGRAWEHPPVHTVFIGGGTPTALPIPLLADALAACRSAFNVLPDAEISSEANPGIVDVKRFAALRALGVNRLSMGVQSFDPAELTFLGRIHSAEEAIAAVVAARSAGFANLNLDFIYGLPGQQADTWRATLQQALALAPEHLSLYSLSVEEGTPFGDWAASGRLSYPDPDLAADLYELADELLAAAGYVQYEISNWARSAQPPGPAENPTNACRHNLTYWRNAPYLGFGPGAHSFAAGQRWAAVRSVPEYIRRVQAGEPVTDFNETIDATLAMGETMILGLRLLREGIPLERFATKHGLTLWQAFEAEVDELARLGLLERLPDRVRLTRRARLVGNQVFARFLPDA
ncbi:MAG: radical SAM family heme chaperone HemW [Caldilineales bacterium]